MSCPDLDVSSVDKVTDEQLEHLEELADKLLERHFERVERYSKENGGKNSRDKLLIVPIVGAGASLSAGIPASGQLREKILEKLKAGGTNVINILDSEARVHFSKAHDGIKDQNLSLFEFASVV